MYSTDRLKVVRGPMRERRQFLDRSAAVLWPAYRQALREYERVVRQRNAALEEGGRGIEPWDERLAEIGGRLRHRRASYVSRLNAALESAFRPEGERYEIVLATAAPRGGEEEEQQALREEIAERRRHERTGAPKPGRPPPRHHPAHRGRARRRGGRLLGAGAKPAARAEPGHAGGLPVRAGHARRWPCSTTSIPSWTTSARRRCAVRWRERGQALVTTAHPGWAEPSGRDGARVRGGGRARGRRLIGGPGRPGDGIAWTNRRVDERRHEDAGHGAEGIRRGGPSASWRGWRPSASGPRCTSGRPGSRACTTSSTRWSTTPWTRPWPATAPRSTSPSTSTTR